MTAERFEFPPITDVSSKLDSLLGAYSKAVDAKDWDTWLRLFADPCSYAVYGLENIQAGLPLGYMIDDCRERLLDRVKFMTEVWAGTVEPYQTRHTVQRLDATADGQGNYDVISNLLVTYTEPGETAKLLASGYYEDKVRITQSGAWFSKRVVYIDGLPARYLVYPL